MVLEKDDEWRWDIYVHSIHVLTKLHKENLLKPIPSVADLASEWLFVLQAYRTIGPPRVALFSLTLIPSLAPRPFSLHGWYCVPRSETSDREGHCWKSGLYFCSTPSATLTWLSSLGLEGCWIWLHAWLCLHYPPTLKQSHIQDVEAFKSCWH